MASYTANKNIVYNGELIKKGSEIELTAEQAKVFGEKVSAANKGSKQKAEA